MHDNAFRVMTIADPLGGSLAFERDGQHRPIRTVDRYGGVTLREFDPRGNVTRLTDAAGNVTEADHNARNDPTRLKDGNGNTTTFDYDGGGNLLHLYRPLGKTTTNRYSTAGNGDLITATDQDDFTTSYSHDQWGYTTGVTDPTGVGFRLTFDAGGRLTQRLSTGQHTIDYDYNPVTAPRARVTVTMYPGAGRTLQSRTDYDKVGRVFEIADANSHITRYGYDLNGNTTSVVVARGTIEEATTRYVYDEADAAKRWTDADGRQTDYKYDGLGRPLLVIAPAPDVATGALRTRYTYDDPPRTVQVRDPRGRTTTTTHDPLGQATQIDYPPTDDAPRFTVSFSYDGVGNRTRLTDRLGVTGYAYDALDRLLTTTTPQSSWGQGRTATVQYTYDQPDPRRGGVRTCTVLTYPLIPDDPRARAATSCADGAGRLKTVTDWNAKTTTYSYDGAGRLTGTAYPNQTTATYGYDDADRLTSVVNARLVDVQRFAPDEPEDGLFAPLVAATPIVPSAGAVGTPTRPVAPGTPRAGTPTPAPPATGPGVAAELPLAAFAIGPFTSHAYTLDNGGNRLFADELTATGDGSGRTQYQYDGQDRLEGALYPESANWRGYRYTNTGDRRLSSVGAEEFPYTYDDAGRLRRAYDPARRQNATYNYDNNGNQTSKTYVDNRENLTLKYNGANRLVRVDGDQFTTDPEHLFRHTGDGLLAAEKPWIGPWTSYVYDVTRANPAVLLKLDSDGNKAVFSLYGHGLIARVVTGVDAAGAPKPERYTYLHHDGLGSVRAVTDKDARLVAAYNHDAFGGTRSRLIVATIGEENPILFAGEQFDRDTGHYYLRARRYDPTTGRFTQPDPIGPAGGQNPYAYAANNPTTLADHSGLAPEKGEPSGGMTASVGASQNAYMQGSLPGMRTGGRTLPLLQRLARQAYGAVVPGSGTVHGTRVHTKFADLVRGLGRGNLHSEVTYLNGNLRSYGTRGGIRLDVVEGPRMQPRVVYDLKTGGAGLSTARVAEIRSHLPPGSGSIPIIEISAP